jgi:hypothetical protein
MLIFFDTEFSDLCLDPRLVSIGLISEDGREFYSELSEYEPKDCGAFTQEAVLPLLQGGDVRMTIDQLTTRFGDWIKNFEQPVQLATDSLSWDWPWIQEIFYPTEKTWPANLNGKPASLYEMIDSPFFERAVEQAFESHQPRLSRHHALDDAKANRFAYLAWKAVSKD